MNVVTLLDFPIKKIYILFNKKFRIILIHAALKKLKCKNLYELALRLNKQSKKYNLNSKFNGGDIKYWISGKRKDLRVNKIYKKFMPLWLALELAKIGNFSISNLQKNTIAYRSGSRGKLVSKPKLPIQITPELESIIIHLFGDGHAGDHTPAYYQKNVNTRRLFIKKLKNCFGEFKETIYEPKWQVRFPKAITDILTKQYNIKSYLSKKSELPNKILNRKTKINKLACLTSFIVDEGYIRNIISMCSANKKLLTQIKGLAEDCNYICNPVRYEKQAKVYVFTISNKSLNHMQKDLLGLTKCFPTCGLLHKQNKFDNLVKNR